MKEETRNLIPSVTLDFQLLELLAIKHVKNLDFFKGKRLFAKAECGYNDEMTGNIIISCEE